MLLLGVRDDLLIGYIAVADHHLTSLLLCVERWRTINDILDERVVVKMDLVVGWPTATAHWIHLTLELMRLRIEQTCYVPRAGDVWRLDIGNIFIPNSSKASAWTLPFTVWIITLTIGIFPFESVTILVCHLINRRHWVGTFRNVDLLILWDWI